MQKGLVLDSTAVDPFRPTLMPEHAGDNRSENVVADLRLVGNSPGGLL